MAKFLFYYFGDDEAYYRTLVAEFKRHSRLDLDFIKLYESDEQKIQSFFSKVVETRPACIFIDFSKQTQDYLHLARIICRTLLEYPVITVGLVDYLSPPDVIMESILTGVHFTHIKSTESFDVVYDVARLVSPKEVADHGFATATLNEDWEAGVPVKVGFVHSEGFHIETDYKLQEGHKVRLNHHWTQKRIVPSREFFVKGINSINLFYQFKYAADLDFTFVDEFLPQEGMEPEMIEEKKKERGDLIIHHRKQLNKWIEDNISRSLEKKIKVLVVDPAYHFYNEQPRTDKHAYIIRCVPFIQDIGQQIDCMRPQVIVFSMDKEEIENSKNNIETIVKLAEALKVKMADTKPFIIIFNSTIDSQEMKEKLQYDHVISTDSELSVPVIVGMVDKFEKKMNDDLIKQKVIKANCVYLKKTNSAAIAEVLISIKVTKLSESDLIFQSDIPLPIGMNLHLTNPVDMYINIQPGKGQGKVPEYQGLIHCLGEAQKKDLRRFVNSVFFRDHDAQLTAESEEFKKLNEAKLNEKLEAAKKLQEALLATKKDNPEDSKS